MPAMKQDISPSTHLTAPQAIQACIASLAAEAFELGHLRAARVLAEAAALLSSRDVWADRQ